MSTLDDAPEAASIATQILLELLKGRALTIRDVMEEFDRSYQQSRRYLHAIDHAVDLEVEQGDERQNIYRLRPRSVEVSPGVYVEDTGQMPLLGAGVSDDEESS